MAERLVELIRDLAKDSKDARVQELLALVGTEGDPHEITQRSDRHDEDEQPEDTNRNADVDSVTGGDVRYQPGDGFFISRIHIQTNKAFDVKPKFKVWNGTKKGGEWEGQFIPQGLILAMAKEIEAHQKLVGAAVRYRQGLHDRHEKNHTGLDTEKGSKRAGRDLDDDYKLDTSQSYIYVGSTQGTDTWLNGSAVAHARFISIQIGGPDGREIVRISLTFDQFAAALVSHSHVPCTVTSYWSRSNDSVWLTERVRRPPSLKGRMEARLRGRFDEKFKHMEALIQRVKEQADAGKPMAKTALNELAREMDIAMGHMDGLAEFTVGQSLEEVSGIVEQAAIHLSQTYNKLTPAQIAQSPALADIMKPAALPAPKE